MTPRQDGLNFPFTSPLRLSLIGRRSAHSRHLTIAVSIDISLSKVFHLPHRRKPSGVGKQLSVEQHVPALPHAFRSGSWGSSASTFGEPAGSAARSHHAECHLPQSSATRQLACSPIDFFSDKVQNINSVLA